jgi:molybdopterin converting factor small subunit
VRIAITFFNIVRHFAGMPGMEVELSDNASLGELLQEVGRRVGDNFPAWIWNPQNQSFNPGILVFVDNEQVRDLTRRLHDGSQVFLAAALLGG